jgi:mannose-6-phosphate isomerase-like protein (cupin superfamily)
MRVALISMAVLTLSLGGCGWRRGGAFNVPSRAMTIRQIPWTADELKQPISVVEVRRGNWSSHHVVRLAGAEKPHVHERHDVLVTLLRGRVRMHVGEQVWIMEAGDVADIPHGTPHWAQNIVRDGASEAYVVFTPPYDGQDSTPAP